MSVRLNTNYLSSFVSAEELTNIRLYDIHPNAEGHHEIAKAVAQHRGLSLDQTSTLVKELEADPQVTSASVYTAKSEDADLNAEVAMTIILEKEVEQ